jgi:hypothetical protein
MRVARFNGSGTEESVALTWEVYNRGQWVGTVEGTSVHDARQTASRQFSAFFQDHTVVLRDDKGPGRYRIGYQVRPLGALGRYTEAHAEVVAKSARDAWDKFRDEHRDTWDFGFPSFVDFLGPEGVGSQSLDEPHPETVEDVK